MLVQTATATQGKVQALRYKCDAHLHDSEMSAAENNFNKPVKTPKCQTCCRYNNSGKTFYIGHWEGDWCLRDTYNKSAPANPKKVQTMIKLLTDKQRAVDAAKKDNPWAKNVSALHLRLRVMACCSSNRLCMAAYAVDGSQ